MNDINFMIVNSKLQHAVLLRRELENRVSFDVFQDNDEVDVWNKMEGGKDDVYIYDRCGKLAYFIPYPLSVMASADSLVPKAIMSVYLRSPCSDTCDGNSSLADNETSSDFSNNITIANTGMEQDISNSHHLNVSVNDTSSQTNPSRNSIVNLFFNSSNNYSSVDTSSNSNSIEMNQTQSIDRNSQSSLPRNDRCLEADIQVCKDYSKRRLLRIQACCLAENSDDLACRSFTPRRCKKMQTVIKCCIKTTISDPTTTENAVELETTTDEHVKTSTDTENRIQTQASM